MRLVLVALTLAVIAAGQSPLSDEILAAHNAVRQSVKVPPLVWSDRLAVEAQQWADHLLAWREFKHSHKPNLGENLYESIGSDHASPQRAVASWAAEAAGYDHGTNLCYAVCGHYTQIVWRDTKRVGCGVARGMGVEIWVCNYDPPGNFVGRRPY